ncbi:PspC domain-containing protein [Mycoplasma sp. P36-A1]|uniref:PspC domain-containing protein n=1 Tax=Mycoplasma sp. P36-A1 TaxID=3252900 RepID=UPI003C2B169A
MEKKLYKTAYDKMISGVCNGLSEYFGVDVSLIRIAFALAGIISFGAAIIFYIALVIILPTKNYR